MLLPESIAHSTGPEMDLDTRERILNLARSVVQAHGYGALSFRELAKDIGIKSASVHYHFPSKGDLGAELARLYVAKAASDLAKVQRDEQSAAKRIAAYAAIFGHALTDGNRMCLCGMLGAERDNLPQGVRDEVEAFATLNIAWLADVLSEEEPDSPDAAIQARAQAIYAGISGAQLVARASGDPAQYDAIVAAYRACGLIPG